MKSPTAKQCRTAAALAAMSLVATMASAEIELLSVTLNTTTPYTLWGTDTTWALSVPKFDVGLGTLYGIKFSNSNNFTVDAVMNAQGGIFIPPYFVDGWNFASLSYFQWQGPGVDYTTTKGVFGNGGGNYPLEHGAAVNKTDQASSNIPPLDASAKAFASYIGSGTVQMTFTAGVTTAVGMPATPGGFTTLFSTITAAGLAQASSSILNIEYYYDAAPVPEPGTWALLLAGLGVTAFAAHRRTLTRHRQRPSVIALMEFASAVRRKLHSRAVRYRLL